MEIKLFPHGFQADCWLKVTRPDSAGKGKPETSLNYQRLKLEKVAKIT